MQTRLVPHVRTRATTSTCSAKSICPTSCTATAKRRCSTSPTSCPFTSKWQRTRTRSAGKNQSPRSTDGVRSRTGVLPTFTRKSCPSRRCFWTRRAPTCLCSLRRPRQSACLATRGYQGGFHWQHGEPSVTETLWIIRSFVHSRIDKAPKRQGFLSSRAQAVKDLAEETAGEIERALEPQVGDHVGI